MSSLKQIVFFISMLINGVLLHADPQGIMPGGCVVDLLKVIFPHDQIKEYVCKGNAIKGLATASMGSDQFEVWRTSWAVGGCTNLHQHETQEIFIFLKGEGRVDFKTKKGTEQVFFKAPCTILCPANVPHQFFNLGEEPTESIVILGVNSAITDVELGEEMKGLPWRK